jgi:conjugal transfer mating pair stabilization protein TraG
MNSFNIPGNWLIYTASDAKLLDKSFNSIAMIFGDGSYSQMAVIGLTLSLFFVAIRYFMAMRFEAQHIFLSFIVFTVMFTPKTTVLIQEVSTGAVYTVANVPVGVAIPSSIVTIMGRRLTEIYEQATATPTEAQLGNGYLDSLNVLMHFRDIDVGSPGSQGYTPGEYVDIKRSIKNYIESCVMVDIDSPNPSLTEEQIKMSADPWATMGSSNFINIDTITFLPGNTNPSGTQQQCAAAYVAINGVLGTFTAKWGPYVNAVLGKVPNANTAALNTNNALTSVGQAAVSGQTFMMNALMKNLYQEASTEYAAQNGVNTSAVVIKTEAVNSRNVLWAAEGSVFDKYAKPFMAFIEMFVIIAAPIVGFLVTLGPTGLSLAGKYMMLMAWTSLWPPVMAMCNMYIHSSVERQFTELTSTGVDLSSINGMDHIFTTAQQWIATGGMMAAATPVLSLFLVTGAIQSVMGIAGKMSSGGIDTATASPKLATGGPVVNTGSGWEMDRMSGAIFRQGAHDMAPNINGVKSYEASVNKAQQMQTSAAVGFSTAFDDATGHDYKSARTEANNKLIARSLDKSLGSNFALTRNDLVGSLIQKGYSESEAVGIANKAAVNATLGVPFVAGVTADLSRNNTISTAEQQSTAEMINSTFSKGSTLSQDMVAKGSRARSALESVMQEESFTKGSKESVHQAFDRVVQATDAVSNATSDSSRQAATVSMPIDHIMKMAEKVPGLTDELKNAFKYDTAAQNTASQYLQTRDYISNNKTLESMMWAGVNSTPGSPMFEAAAKIQRTVAAMNGPNGESVTKSVADMQQGVSSVQSGMQDDVSSKKIPSKVDFSPPPQSSAGTPKNGHSPTHHTSSKPLSSGGPIEPNITDAALVQSHQEDKQFFAGREKQYASEVKQRGTSNEVKVRSDGNAAQEKAINEAGQTAAVNGGAVLTGAAKAVAPAASPQNVGDSMKKNLVDNINIVNDASDKAFKSHK